MFRLFVVLLIAAGIAGGVAYYNGWLEEYMVDSGLVNILPPMGGDKAQQKDLGDLLYATKSLPPLERQQQRPLAQLVVDPCHAVVPLASKQEVSSPKDGEILFVGRFASEKVAIPGVSGHVQKVQVYDGVAIKDRWFHPLKVGDIVEQNQVLVVVNPAQANHDVGMRQVKVLAAKADYDATVAILNEVRRKLLVLEDLYQRNPANVSQTELGEARVTVEKYKGDEITKGGAIRIADYELWQASLIQYERHFRCQLPGRSIVKQIYKGLGEGIKPQEPVLQLWNMSELKIEGSVDSQFYQALRSNKNARCYLEPSVEMAPRQELEKSHFSEVHSVAVCADGEHFVSGSEDTKVYVWNRRFVHSVKALPHHFPVRTVACSPKGRFVLVGCSDGSLTLWDLTNLDTPKSVEFKEKHRGSVTALAFSPDGTHFASGGEDSSIMVWKTTGEVLYTLDAANGAEDPHQGTITSLRFTPQSTLISAARDNTLRVWELHKHGAKRLGEALANRGGTVSQLDVSGDGRYMLFDKGKTLHLLNTVDGSNICVLNNLSGSNPFDTLALFSPDGKVMLTGGAGEGRLHLWKTPTVAQRAYQLRELVAPRRAAITSAAFAPAGFGFAISGDKDGFVQLWELPNEAEVNSHLISKGADGKDLQINLIEPDLNAGKMRIAINFANPQIGDGFLLSPGQRMTVIVELSR